MKLVVGTNLWKSRFRPLFLSLSEISTGPPNYVDAAMIHRDFQTDPEKFLFSDVGKHWYRLHFGSLFEFAQRNFSGHQVDIDMERFRAGSFGFSCWAIFCVV